MRWLVDSLVGKENTSIFRTQMCETVLMTTCYMNPLQSYINPHQQPPSYFLNTLILSSQLQLCLPSCLLPYGFPTQTQYAFSFQHTQPTFPPDPFFVISSSESFVSTNYEATHYTIPSAHSKTATTLIGHPVCGWKVEYVRIVCWGRPRALLTTVLLYCAMV